jgi:hypothetical protein
MRLGRNSQARLCFSGTLPKAGAPARVKNVQLSRLLIACSSFREGVANTLTPSHASAAVIGSPQGSVISPRLPISTCIRSWISG